MSFEIEARRRVGTGKGAGRRIRSRGMVPAVLYGNGGAAVNLAVKPAVVKQVLKSPMGINSVFSVKVEGGESVAHARLVAFQKDPVKRTLVHCDFQRLDPAKPIKVRIPITLEGVSEASKQGSRVRFVTRWIMAKCLPGAIPESIVVDQTNLEPSSELRLSEVVAPEDVELIFGDNAPVLVAQAAGGLYEEEAEDEAEGEEGDGEAEGEGDE